MSQGLDKILPVAQAGKVLDPVTGKPVDTPRTPIVPGPMPHDIRPRDPMPTNYIVGVAIYNPDQTFVKYVPVDDAGNLEETITIEENQIVIMLHPIAKATPNPGTMIKKVGVG